MRRRTKGGARAAAPHANSIQFCCATIVDHRPRRMSRVCRPVALPIQSIIGESTSAHDAALMYLLLFSALSI